MSTFKWAIWDVADDAVSAVQGGVVDLRDAKVVTTAPSWQIQTPDGSDAPDPQPGGTIDLIEKHRELRISRGVLNFAAIVLVLVLGFILVHDAMRDHLTFGRFLYELTPFLAGLAGFTVGNLKRP
jgi:hypothetical protein